MSGTKAGSAKATARILAKDPDFFKKIGAAGGRKSRNGGFASDIVGEDGMTGKQRASLMGQKGGRKSKRTKKVQ